MDLLIERFERLLRSFINPDVIDDDWESAADDRDFREAYAEIDDFLKNGGSDKSESVHTGRSHADYRFRMPPESLRKDYGNLMVSFGAPFDQVKKSYRELMRRHHPDLHSSDPRRQSRSTRIAQELNISYQRIKAWELAKQGA